MKNEIKNPESSVKYTLQKQWKLLVPVVIKIVLLILFIKMCYLGQQKSNFIKINKLAVFQINN